MIQLSERMPGGLNFGLNAVGSHDFYLDKIHPDVVGILSGTGSLTTRGGTSGRLAHAQDETDVDDDIVCDVCNIKITDCMYCLDCRQILCRPCRGIHTKMRVSMGHTLVAMKTQTASGKHESGFTKCSKHRLLYEDLFCVHCRREICIMCKLLMHQRHATIDFPPTRERHFPADKTVENCEPFKYSSNIKTDVPEHVDLQRHEETRKIVYKDISPVSFYMDLRRGVEEHYTRTSRNKSVGSTCCCFKMTR